jgi:hypothetical protein
MLQRFLVTALVMAIAVLVGASGLMAQGKGKGLNKALSKASGKGGANSALNRAGQNASRVGGSLNRANGLGRAGALSNKTVGGKSLGAARGGSSQAGESAPLDLTDAAARHQRQLVIEQTNRDRRITQAQHLREIAARNGNAELADNADRLETFANEHYEARVAQLSRFGVSDPNLPTDPGTGEPPVPQPDPGTDPTGETPTSPTP